MNVLLDTHVLLWWLDDYSSISEKAYKAIAASDNLVFVSAVSIWEIRIKEALGKLKIPEYFQKIIENESFEMLAISAEHAHFIAKLPLVHKDPFDRMLVAQAKYEKLTLITHDSLLKKYKIPVILA